MTISPYSEPRPMRRRDKDEETLSYREFMNSADRILGDLIRETYDIEHDENPIPEGTADFNQSQET